MSETPQQGADRTGDRSYLQQRLPFADVDQDEATAVSELSRSLRGTGIRSGSPSNLSSSYSHRIPTRSYYHHASHGNLDQLHYSSQGVREQTQEIASWALGESPKGRLGPAIGSASESDWTESMHSEREPRTSFESGPRYEGDSAAEEEDNLPTIEQVTEPFLPKKQPLPRRRLSSAHRKSDIPRTGRPVIVVDDVEPGEVTETTALLGHNGPRTTSQKHRSGYKWLQSSFDGLEEAWYKVSHPSEWDVQQMTHVTIGAVSAVLLGLLLNVLDALSYGMILFPLGEDIFQNTGPDGISMFYVSCIVSQLTYSLGGSAFAGGVGSEMIEVVPFFHKMAYMILNHTGDGNPEVVMATVITSYAISSILTGVIFLLLGALRLGDLVSFFPRSILLGCIGGVGVFLFLTGIEVSAGLDSSIGWGIDTIKRLLYPSTLPLWGIPLFLSVSLMVIRKYLQHPVVMPAFFVAVVAIFYIVMAALPNVDLNRLRKTGWVFEAPEAGAPFYNFYTYYNFRKVDWEALGKTIPTMFALSFFGIIHVPINVPALGIAVQQDDININRELFGHGVSNALSGLLGSIQNYLVFANSRLFIQNGGNSRWAGVLLALGTTGIWIAGPAMIGFIPIMIVGTLIFMLGIEMVQEALWDTFGKIHLLEYLMVLAITVVMGFYDFVVGIVLGIVLACFNFVVQTSRVSAIRATYSGTVVESTVRRHPLHRRFLHAVGGQIKITKLAGYLFFGSIVAVEKRVRDLIDEEAFSRQPIRYLILDFTHVTGLDFSAAEAFVRMHRVLHKKDVEMLISGITLEGEVGRSLIMVGLLENEGDIEGYPPRVFEDLNQALEACENELLLAFKQRTEHLAKQGSGSPHTASMVIPQFPYANLRAPEAILSASPRRNQVAQAATTALESHAGDLAASESAKWASFAQPLPLILQAFKDVTTKDFDFWHRATPYFTRREIAAGSVLYTYGDIPNGLYLLETGVLRAEYELDSGKLSENIVAGTTLGDLTFFARPQMKTTTTTVVAETDSVAWVLTQEKWELLEKEWKEGEAELLKVGIGLLGERMRSITSYVLVTAS